jgi:hypothetical protein
MKLWLAARLRRRRWPRPREKKKTHDPAVSGEADKRLALKKRPLETTDRVKQIAVKEKESDDVEASGKRARIDPVAEANGDINILPTPQIQPCTNYPPKGSAQRLAEEPSPAGLADAKELEACEARGKRVAELIQKEISMADAAPKERVAGLVDVVDESESLCYIDDDTTRVEKKSRCTSSAALMRFNGCCGEFRRRLGCKGSGPD